MTAPDALSVFACDPLRTGLILRGWAGSERDAILAGLAATGLTLRKLPPHVSAERLTGGLDLAATLAAGREIRRDGLLAAFAGQVLVLGAAERWNPRLLAPILAALDAGLCGVIACDESAGEDALPAALIDRCALQVALPGDLPVPGPAAAAKARALLPFLIVNEELVATICVTAAALGVGSLRACLAATRVAAAAAALSGHTEVALADAMVAAALVLAPRATRLPPAEEQPEPQQAPEEPQNATPDAERGAKPDPPAPAQLDDMVLQAALAALPPNLLAQLAAGPALRSGSAGRAGGLAKAARRGRPIGARRGHPRDGLRLDLLATLRAAAPWQRLRGRASATDRLHIGRDDLHVIRCRPRAETTTIFAVDASGSAALARLAEAKGAVELLLADCYVRRDRVAVIAFRGPGARVLLPPTRAPARARRALAGLPGGGGTPLASAIAAATDLADAAVRRGETATVVLLTDGQANIARDGAPGRSAAQADALLAARAMRAAGHRCLLIDTANRSQPLARQFAEAMGGRYLALPRADAASLANAIRPGRAA